MRRLLPLPALPLAVLVATPGIAAAQTSQDGQAWINLTVQGPVAGRIVYFAELQPRAGDDVSRLDTLILRGAAGVRVTPRLTLFQGYAHVAQPVAGGPDRNEERSFQQVTWLPPVATGELTSRTRLEQRFRSDGNDTGWRLREMLRYELPLKGTRVRPLGSVEAFVHLDDTDWGTRRGFDQVRTFLGVEIPVFGKSTAELGYLNQVVNQTGGRTAVNHVASISVFIRH